MAESEREDKSYAVLMIDDDEDDFILVKEALESQGLNVDLYWAKDGDEAMNFCSGGADMRMLELRI